jgi:hypothetical protein
VIVFRPGSVITPHVEHPELICESRAFAKRKNVIAPDDCGFSSQTSGWSALFDLRERIRGKAHHPLTMRCNFQGRHGYAPARSQEKRSANQHVSRWLDADKPTL